MGRRARGDGDAGEPGVGEQLDRLLRTERGAEPGAALEGDVRQCSVLLGTYGSGANGRPMLSSMLLETFGSIR
jgi:hypothetical protein